MVFFLGVMVFICRLDIMSLSNFDGGLLGVGGLFSCSLKVSLEKFKFFWEGWEC